MTQRESKLSRRIMDELNAQPRTFVFKVHGGAHMLAGLPDIIGCVDGRFFALESKMPGDRDNVSKIQAYVHGKIRGANGYVAVVCSVAEARRHWGICANRRLTSTTGNQE